MSSCLMPITVRCLPPDVWIKAINTADITLADEEMIIVIYLKCVYYRNLTCFNR